MSEQLGHERRRSFGWSPDGLAHAHDSTREAPARKRDLFHLGRGVFDQRRWQYGRDVKLIETEGSGISSSVRRPSLLLPQGGAWLRPAPAPATGRAWPPAHWPGDECAHARLERRRPRNRTSTRGSIRDGDGR